jgi:hypothetical protein
VVAAADSSTRSLACQAHEACLLTNPKRGCCLLLRRCCAYVRAFFRCIICRWTEQT